MQSVEAEQGFSVLNTGSRAGMFRVLLGLPTLAPLGDIVRDTSS